jgi:hypothetical protein
LRKIPSGSPEYVVEYEHEDHIDSTLPMSAQELTDFLNAAPHDKVYTVQTIQPYQYVSLSPSPIESWDEHRL